MKKLFKKINTRYGASVTAGLIFAAALAMVGPVLNAQSTAVVPLIANSSSLVSRIGSLAIAGPLPSQIAGNPLCINRDTNENILNNGDAQTCLSVAGLATFSNLLVRQVTYVGGSFIVGDITLPGTSSNDGIRPTEPNFIVKSDGTSILVGGLVYPDPANFSPRDSGTSEREICSDERGILVICDATAPIVNGQCGSANGATTASTPNSGLCNAGTPSAVAGNGSVGTSQSSGSNGADYTWTCAGSNGGTTASCSSNQTSNTVNGQCAVFNDSYGTQPAFGQGSDGSPGNACISGTYSDTPADTATNWQWSCLGADGGTNQVCQAERTSYNWDVGQYGACVGASVTKRQRIQFDVSNADGNHNVCITGGGNPYQVPPARSTQYNATPYVRSNGTTVTGAFGGSNYIDSILQDNGVPAGGGGNTPSFTITFPDNNCTVGQFYCGGSGVDIYTRCEFESSTPGTQTRPVVCRDSNGNTAPESLCPSPKPDTSRSCTQ